MSWLETSRVTIIDTVVNNKATGIRELTLIKDCLPVDSFELGRADTYFDF